MPLLEADIDRLEAVTGQPAVAFVDDSDGWRLLKGTGTGGGCVFLGPIQVGGRTATGCTLHEHRPEACRHYPFILQGDDPPTVTEDTLCPFRTEFTPPPDVRERLVALERQLEDERRGRKRHDGG